MSPKHRTLADYEGLTDEPGTADRRLGKKASGWGACFPLLVANSLYLPPSLYHSVLV